MMKTKLLVFSFPADGAPYLNKTIKEDANTIK